MSSTLPMVRSSPCSVMVRSSTSTGVRVYRLSRFPRRAHLLTCSSGNLRNVRCVSGLRRKRPSSPICNTRRALTRHVARTALTSSPGGGGRVGHLAVAAINTTAYLTYDALRASSILGQQRHIELLGYALEVRHATHYDHSIVLNCLLEASACLAVRADSISSCAP